nr:MOP flippase family protein [uncultured Carboxylicivirga sp.]
MTFKKQVVKGVKWTSIANLIIIICNVLKLSILTRLINKSDFGIIAIVNIFLGFVNLFVDMGISSAIFHKQEISKDQYSSLYWTNVAFSFVIYLGLVFLSPIISCFYEDDIYKEIIPIMGVSILFFAFGRQFKVIEEKKLSFKRIALVESTSAILGLVVAILLGINRYGVYSLVLSVLVQYLLSNLIYLYYGIINNRISFHYNYKETRSFLSIGIYQVGSQIINYFNRDFDVLIFGKVFGPDITGAYSLAKQLAMRPSQVINPIITKVATPALSKFQNDMNKLKDSYLKVINLIASINLPTYIILFVFSEQIIHVMYGSDYIVSAKYLKILSVIMFIRSIGNPIGSLIIAMGKTKLEFKWNLFVTFIVPVVLFFSSKINLDVTLFCLVTVRLLLFIPSWKFLILPLTGIKFKELLKGIFDFRSYLKNLNYIKIR